MIEWEGRGDMLQDSVADTLLCPINAAGVMGKGLAKTMRDRYSGLYDAYMRVYSSEYGHPDMETRARRLIRVPVTESHRWVLNDNDPVVSVPQRRHVLLFCTKMHWRDGSPKSLVKDNLLKLALEGEALGIQCLAMPMIGAGLGQLPRDWVYQAIERYLSASSIRVRLYV